MSILQNINSHEDLQTLTHQDRLVLCDELRKFLVDSISQTGGHLASNLGMVELSVAIETVYDTNVDRLVYDVGHQSYVHKLLTGRQADFSALRQYGGIAGFPKPSESVSDAFVAGHASSSVSIALGMARARTIQNEKYHVITVIGDGAATGGMAYEGLNDAAVSGENMVIILNDNEMSIAPNVGGFAQHLRRLRTKEGYLGFKQRYRVMMSKSKMSRFIYRITHKIKDRVKRLLLPATIFENMGLTYLGPVDGNDVQDMIGLLRIAKEMSGPILIHTHTRKGKGYEPAEKNPSKFHGVGKFDVSTGEMKASSGISFSHNFGKVMMDLASTNPRICAITAAMPDGTGLLDFMRAYPHRFFDVGIAEEHAISMAGGLAKQGMVPIVALYSTFLQRGFDQIIQDIALMHLHVVLAVDRAGMVGEDGETHHGVFDVGYLRMIPGMTVLCPASLQEQEDMLRWAIHDHNGPVAIRYPRGGNRWLTTSNWCHDATSGFPSRIACHAYGKDVIFVTYGVLIDNVMKAAEILENRGISVGVIRLLSVNPLPADEVAQALGECRHVIVVEETGTGAGIKEALAWELQHSLFGCRVDGFDLGKHFISHGDIVSLYKHCGLDAQSIADRTEEALRFEK
ncbi:MAG: 1-deoxy-D-xylulose-5-phosphate synthase [Bacteroidaceae bacterium]|nr:1-deoxy-D-xylulose-5-phosphate synthase [Bacteroidaceae bacterium]